jgi:GABA permease
MGSQNVPDAGFGRDRSGKNPSMTRRVLVVATSNVDPDEASSAVADRTEDAEVRVVAPASGLSRLDWLANAEDDERADAAARAEDVADAIPTDRVAAEVGDTDPVQAIDDAVRTFDPDEVLLVTRPEDDVSWLEAGTGESARRRFDVPITHVVVP